MGIRFFLSILFTIVISHISWGQHYVDVVLRPQLQNKWCWAACIEMIDQFHKNNISTITQCDIACKFEYFRQMSLTVSPASPPFVNCCKECNSTGYTCNQTISFSRRVAKPKTNYFGILNSFYGYSSIEDIEINKLNWARITQEIQSCRPFVLYLNKYDSDAKKYYSHLVVGEGTYEAANGTQFVVVNDPQIPGSDDLIPFLDMIDPVIQLNSVFQIARGIFPKDAEECKSCGDKLKSIDDHPLIKASLKNANLGLFFGLTKTTFTPIEYNALLEKSSGPLKYYYENTFSYENLKGDEALRCKVLVAKEANPQIATTFQKVGSNYLVKEITLQASTPFTSAIKLFNAANKSFAYSSTEFEIIQFVPDSYQFYKVRMDGVSYLSPANIYPDIPFKQYYMYKEADVRKELAKIDADVKDIIKKQERTLSKELKRFTTFGLQKTN